jgi:RHS repeat-associated protein
VEKVVYAWDPQQWSYVPQSTNRFVYEGWNLVTVLDQNHTPLLSFVWGMDLSGTSQGAGGVGGLVSVTAHSGPDAGTYFYCYDGNGNVAGLINAADGRLTAQYGYGPFGEVLRATGPVAKANPFRFSTKYQDEETDLVRYEPGRYYGPSWGGWLSRDPIGEQGGPNLYGFVGNGPIDKFDILGNYPSTYRFSLADMQAMLRQSKEDFRRKLKALCPIFTSVAWTAAKGQKQCCSPDACHVQADVLTMQLAQKLEVNFTTEYQRFGDVLAFTPLWIPGETINDRANRAPHQGTIADDYNQGYGLKCLGMQNLMQITFVEVMKPLQRAGQQCFKGANVGNNPDRTKASHHWFGIYGPFSDDVHDIDVEVDPWFSAGGIIAPDFPLARAQYFNQVLW